MSQSISRLSLVTGLLAALGGCGSSAAGTCKIDSDCASHSCDESGQYNTNPGPDAGSAEDAGADAMLSACGGALDGQIDRGEVPLEAGKKAVFRIASPASFDTSGELIDGEHSWNLDQDFASDVDVQVELFDTQAAWYHSSFPDASYAVRLSQDSDLLGVFRLADDGLFLLGVVSPEDGLARTELSYDPPALLMPLPLVEGASFKSDSSVSGVASGIASFYSESYAGQADASGTLITPFGSFRVIRVGISLTRTLGLVVTKTRQFNFVSECAGIVGSIVSKEGEEAVEFSELAELRRLVP